MAHFTPLTALAGGLPIGVAAVLLLWLNGRIAGVSNVTGGLLAFQRGDVLWRLPFLGAFAAALESYAN